MLHAKIDRDPLWRARRSAGRMHGFRQTVVIDRPLQAAEALVVDIDAAERVTGKRASRVRAAQLPAKRQPR